MASDAEIARTTHEFRAGNENTFDQLFIRLYKDFRSLARSYLAREAQSSTLQATALVNEAYLKLAAQKHVD
jgi:DNA-directed RNA polymerase specialized sigma24 family protein